MSQGSKNPNGKATQQKRVAMKLNKKVYIVGGYNTSFIGKHHPDFIWKRHPDFGKRENPTLEQLMKEAVDGAFEATGVAGDAIDRAYVGNFAGQLFVNQGHLGAMLARVHKDLVGKPIMRMEAACASGGIAVVAGIDALQANTDVVLAVGAEVQTSVPARHGADYLARASHYETERELDEFTFPALFARRNKAYKAAYGITDADVAPVVVKAYANANRNPKAHMQAVKMTLEQASAASKSNPNFLANEDLHDHLKISDCSQVSDGASAIILATEEGLKKLGIAKETCIEVLSYGFKTAGLAQVEDLLVLDNTKAAAEEAYNDAGIGPNDIQVAEVHDCFAVTEVLMYEALGWADKGKGTELAKEGATTLEGRIPVNTGGGLMAFGHPVGATGIKQMLEIHRQMKGQCGDYQVPNSPTYGLTANMGGDDRTSVVMTFKNVT